MPKTDLAYVYGLLPPNDVQLVQLHFDERTRLWNKLAEIHNRLADAFDTELRTRFPRIKKHKEELDFLDQQLHQITSPQNAMPADQTADIEVIKQAKRQAYQQLKTAIATTDAVKSLSTQYTNQFYEQANAQANASFLWWPNHGSLLQEFIKARAKAISRGTRVKNRLINGEGALYAVYKQPTPLLKPCLAVKVTL